MHFYGQNAAIESITVFKHIFERFLVFFWKAYPKNSMVFTSPNQLSLVFQKVRFFALLGTPFGTKHAHFGHPLAPRGRQKPVRWRKKTHPGKSLKKTGKQKPVLAREWEARFIFGTLAEQLTFILQKRMERVQEQELLNSSPTPSSRAIVYCTILCSAMLYETMLYYAMLGYALLCFALPCPALYYSILYCTILYSTLPCTLLYYTA